MQDNFVLMSPYRLKASLATTLREVAAKRGCSLTFIIQEALKDWLEKRGVDDPDEAENLRRLEERKKAQEAREAQAAAEAEAFKLQNLIDHMTNWRKHGGGKPYPYLNGRPCPPGFEDVARGNLQPIEEEI